MIFAQWVGQLRQHVPTGVIYGQETVASINYIMLFMELWNLINLLNHGAIDREHWFDLEKYLLIDRFKWSKLYIKRGMQIIRK